MRTEEVTVPAEAELEGAEAAIEQCFEEAGLRVVLKGTLAAHRGCLHWHLKRGKERGTLEVTLWPERRRLWMSVHANRGGEWIEDALIRLKASLAVTLNRRRSHPSLDTAS